MAVTLYTSGDASSPVLTGEIGSLINVLDKCLVSGYGSKTAAGWTMPYTGTNKAVFRAGGGTQSYLRVDDTTTISVSVSGYISMTDVNTGTDKYPKDEQITPYTDLKLIKSTDTTTPQSWILVADNKRFYLSTFNEHIVFFGDIRSFCAGDDYCSMIAMQHNLFNVGQLLCMGTDSGMSCTYLEQDTWMAGSYNGLIKSVGVRKFGNPLFNSSNYPVFGGTGGIPYPNPCDNGLYMGPIYVCNETGKIRGMMPGMWQPYHDSPIGRGDTFGGIGGLTGKQFISLYQTVHNVNPNNYFNTGSCFVEISDTWEL